MNKKHSYKIMALSLLTFVGVGTIRGMDKQQGNIFKNHIINITKNTGNIATNKTSIATNKTNIATNKTNIETNTTNIATNTGNIEKLEKENKSLKTSGIYGGLIGLGYAANEKLNKLGEETKNQNAKIAIGACKEITQSVMEISALGLAINNIPNAEDYKIKIYKIDKNITITVTILKGASDNPMNFVKTAAKVKATTKILSKTSDWVGSAIEAMKNTTLGEKVTGCLQESTDDALWKKCGKKTVNATGSFFAYLVIQTKRAIDNPITGPIARAGLTFYCVKPKNQDPENN